MLSAPTLLLILGLGAVASGCRPGRAAAASDESSLDAVDSNSHVVDSTMSPSDSAASAVVAAPPGAHPQAKPAHALTPLADSISQYLVFDPSIQTWFLAAKRGKRLLVDIGRVDLDLARDPRRGAAFIEAVKAQSPVPIGTPMRIYDAWGAEDDTVVGFDNWQNRIVAILHTSRYLDSLVRRAPTTYAAVVRTDTAPPPTDSSQRTTANAASGPPKDSLANPKVSPTLAAASPASPPPPNPTPPPPPPPPPPHPNPGPHHRRPRRLRPLPHRSCRRT